MSYSTLNRILRKYQNGDKSAADDFITAMEPAIRKLATELGQGVEIEDLVQSGRVGVCKSMKTYNPTLGAGIFTWAYNNARFEMQHFIRDCGSIVRLPSNLSPGERDEIRLRRVDMENVDAPSLDAEPSAVHFAMSRLTPRERLIINARFHEKLTRREIAESYNISPSVAKRIERTALEKIRKVIDDSSY